MKCEDYQELISPYLDDALSYDEKMQLEAHLKACPTCQETLEMMELIMGGLNEMEEAPLPEGFHERLHENLMDELAITNKQTAATTTVVTELPKNKKHPYRFLTYASGLAAALIIGIALVPRGTGQELDVAPIEQAPQVASSRMQSEDLVKNQVAPVQEIAPFSMESQVMPMSLDEEQWNITIEDLEQFGEFITGYCKENQITFTSWQENAIIHYTLQPLSKENFKETLMAQMKDNEHIDIVNPGEEPQLHLIVTIKE